MTEHTRQLERTDWVDGYIVAGAYNTRSGLLSYLGRLADGSTFAAVFPAHEAECYVRQSDLERARESVLDGMQVRPQQTQTLTTIDEEPVVPLAVPVGLYMRDLKRALDTARVRSYEADLSVQDAFRYRRGIRGPVRLRGSRYQGEHVR
mgnify:CR=1 FL=1